jgi:hypothetical protein
MRHKQFDFRTAYIDLLLNVLTGIIFLFLLTTMMIQTKKQDEGIKKDAQYVIMAEWSPDMDCDVDLWVQDPNGEAVSFNRKDFGVMHLERDDMGLRNDVIRDPAGRVVSQVNTNGETWVLRGIIPGEFLVTLHLYSCRYSADVFKAMPIGAPTNLPVKVELIKLNPDYQVLLSETIVLSRVWQELTAFNFTLSADGTLIASDTVQHRLVRIDQ